MASKPFNPLATDERGEATDVEEEVAKYSLSERCRIWKNVLVLSLAFMMHFTAVWGTSNLQASINADEALGTFTLAASCLAIIISNIFLPATFIKFLGCKWAVSISFIAYMSYILSQLYPRFCTMIPAGLAVGFGGGPLWCAKCTYLTVVAEAYSQIVGVSSDVIVTRFFGIFFMFYQMSQVWGNLISSAVLSIPDSDKSTPGNVTKMAINITKLETNTNVQMCGANFEPNQIIQIENPNLVPPPMHKIQLLVGIYLACMIFSCLIVAFFVDSLTKYEKGRTNRKSGLSGMKLLAVTIKQLSHRYQLLILPMTIFIGVQHSFIIADYTANYVSCGWGIQNIGYVMICFGVCNAIAALCIGSIVKITGRVSVIAFGLVIHVGLIVTLQLWTPTSTNTHKYFIVAGFWGLAEAIWLVEIKSLYAILFPGQQEASFSNFQLWEATGAVIGFTYSPYLRTRVKLYLLLGNLLFGVTGYAIIEWLERLDKKCGKNNVKIISEVNNFKLYNKRTTEIAQ